MNRTAAVASPFATVHVQYLEHSPIRGRGPQEANRADLHVFCGVLACQESRRLYICEHRAKPVGAPPEPQRRTNVGPLYAILGQAGVSIEHITE
jgi:hypothetical protein